MNKASYPEFYGGVWKCEMKWDCAFADMRGTEICKWQDFYI